MIRLIPSLPSIALLSMSTQQASAQTQAEQVTSGTMRILGELSSIMPFLNTLAAVLGIYLIIAGTMMWTGIGKQSMYTQITASKIIKHYVAGVMLLSIVFSVGILTRTTVDPTWSESSRSILSLDQRSLEEFDQVANSGILADIMPASVGPVVIAFIFIFGFIFFMKGTWLIVKSGEGGHAQESSMGKVVTHLVGGVICMNLVTTACIVGRTFMSSAPAFC